MAYVLLSQSFGASKANLPATITETSTGIPAVILSSATGGLVNSNGDTRLDGSGNLSCYVDGDRTWTVSVDGGASAGPAGLLTGAQVAAGATAVVGVKSDGTLVEGSGATVGLTPAQVLRTQALASGGRFRTQDVRVVTFGDSTANVGATSSPDTYDTQIVSAAFPASGATVVGAGEAAKWMTSLYYPRARLVGNCGVSGDATAGMLNRDAQVSSTMRKAAMDALNLRPDAVCFRGGSINDLQAITAGTYAATVATCISNHRRILARLLSGSTQLIDVGIFGYGDGAAATSLNPDLVRQAVLECNAAFKAMSSEFAGRVVYLDPQAAGLQALDGRIVAGLSNDGLHLNINGGALLGQAEAAILTEVFGASAGPSYPGTNLLPEAMMQGTTAFGGGVRPNGFSFSGATAFASSIDVIEGRQMWTVDATVAAGAQNILMNAPFPIGTLGLLAGDVIGAEFDFEWTPLNGFAPTLNGLYSRLDIFKTAAGRVVNTANATALASATLPAPSLKGRSVFLPLQLQEPSTNLSSGSSLMVLLIGLTSAGGGQARFRMGVPRLVKL